MEFITPLKSQPVNKGFCQICEQIVPVTHQERDGQIYLVKHCPECGKSKYLVSTDAQRYNQKRTLAAYQGEAERSCHLECIRCDHGRSPSLVFLDVTNRCNMNCPICLANIPAMGFRFDPPIDYFEKVFQRLSTIKPRPKVQLFGGEPTVREDLIDIINLAKAYGISSRVVTNGLRLADENYCRQLLETRCQLMFSFDGRGREIYATLRKKPKSYELKLKALANIRKHHRAKITIMCATGAGINDRYMADLIDFCHEGRDYIAALDMIPLTANWGPEEITGGSSCMEDVERIMSESLPGLDFFPAAMLYKFETLKEAFNLTLTFGGAHPNCESVSMLISDGNRYQPLSHYLKAPLPQLLTEMVRLDQRLARTVKRSAILKKAGHKGIQLVVLVGILNFMRKNVNYHRIFGKNKVLKIIQIIMGLTRGIKLKHLLRRYTRCHNILRMIVLPFEEKACIESARLVDCPASFAFENPQNGNISLMPVCAWPIYKNSVLQKTAQKYGTAKTSTRPGQTDLNVQPVQV